MAPRKPSNITVHPLVLLSVVDHYNRIAKDRRGDKRVVGILLGETFKGKVDITNCYAVPFEEDPKNPNVWIFDVNYHEQMFSMFRRVNANERVLGWYSSGPSIRANDLAIHERLRQTNPELVFVVIDVQLKPLELPTEGYVSVEETDEITHESVRRFEHVETTVGAFEAEEIGVEHLLRDLRDVSLAPVANQISQKLNGLKGLISRLEEILDYLSVFVDDDESSASGAAPALSNMSLDSPKKESPQSSAPRVESPNIPKHSIVYLLQDFVNSLPPLNPRDMVARNVNSNNTLAIIYMASLIRTVASLHDLISNKRMNLQVEKRILSGSSGSTTNSKEESKTTASSSSSSSSSSAKK